MGQLEDALEAFKLKILKYDPTKQRPVSTSEGTMSLEKFCKMFRDKVSAKASKYGTLIETLGDLEAAKEMLEKYAEENGVLAGKKVNIEIPPDMQNLTLNLDLTAKGRDDKFFLTHEDETVSRVAGDTYLMIHQISPLEAASNARKVIPEYMPRGPRGVSEVINNGKTETMFNIYQPPGWVDYDKNKWASLPDELPPLFKKLVRHLFPVKLERRYFYAWLHASLFDRAFVYLILCSSPGTGKNRLKLVLRALHGHVNSIDGKKSTLVERFNSQLAEATLAWFDELHYDQDMENVMKEIQNDSISIERKGVDATRGTKIYSSLIISNNKPRDNYIAFDARKFVPLKMTDKRLEASMTPDEIDELTRKVVDPTSKTFDVRFLAQIAKWIKAHGASKRWPNLEYRGPMFWTLAHTSMARWQKKAVMQIMEPNRTGPRTGWDESKGAFLWSAIHEKATKKNGDRSLQFPDFTTVRAFFEVFRDEQGRKAFDTFSVSGYNILGDFYVKPLFKKMGVVTEASIMEQREKANAKVKKAKYDL